MVYKPYIKGSNGTLVDLPLCADQVGVETIGSNNEPIYLHQGEPKVCDGLKQLIVDLVYPVGAYFITESSSFNTTTKVANYFGGTWVRVEGRFLYGSSSAGGTGGSNDAVIPSHNHTFTGTASSHRHKVLGSTRASDSYCYSVGNSACLGGLPKNDTGNKYGYYDNNSFNSGSGNNLVFIENTSITPSGTISTVGSSTTNANMPAYRTVYMYRRTA